MPSPPVPDVLRAGVGADRAARASRFSYTRGDSQTFLIPDVLVTLGAGDRGPASGRLRKAHRIWDDGPPELAIEIASLSTVERGNVGKKEHYAFHGIREYVRFDPLAPYDPEGPCWCPRCRFIGWRGEAARR